MALTHKIHDLRAHPIHEHDCDKCVFVGGMNEVDMWFCNEERPMTVICRYGPNGDYGSGMQPAINQIRHNTIDAFDVLPYGYALLASIGKGLLLPSHAAQRGFSPDIDELISERLIREKYAEFVAPQIGKMYCVISGAFIGEVGTLCNGIHGGTFHLKTEKSKLLVVASQLRPIE